jgi:very-short-patch-repair endonuclease
MKGVRSGYTFMKRTPPQFFNRCSQKAVRQHLRNNATRAERVLWRHLRDSVLLGFKFRRQHGIGPYIVDFYCPEAKLAVELDGAVHFTIEATEYDRIRDEFLIAHGIKTLRFQNGDVWNNIDALLKTIIQNLPHR